MRGDGQHRRMAAMALEQPIDQVQVARPAASGADREFAGDRSLAAGGEGRHFLMADMHPVDAAETPQAVDEAVEAIAGDAPDALDTGLREYRCPRADPRSFPSP